MKRKVMHHRNIGHDTTACGQRGLAKWRCTFKRADVTCIRCRDTLAANGHVPKRKPPKRVERLPVGLPAPSPEPASGDFIDRQRYAAELQNVRERLAEWERVSVSCVSPGETLGTGNKLAMAVLLLVQKL